MCVLALLCNNDIMTEYFYLMTLGGFRKERRSFAKYATDIDSKTLPITNKVYFEMINKQNVFIQITKQLQ